MKSLVVFFSMILILSSCSSDKKTNSSTSQNAGGSEDVPPTQPEDGSGDSDDNGGTVDDGNSGDQGDSGGDDSSDNGNGDTGGDDNSGDQGNNDDDGDDNNTPVTCPDGFVKIAGATFDKAICVAQYEMKSDGSVVVSKASDTPLSITRAKAQRLCEDSFSKGRLPTNAEWTKIADIIKSQNMNWTGGAVGSGTLITGLTKKWSDPVSVSNTSDAYDQTGYSTNNSPDQRRTFYIDANTVLWDFGGNAWEWVSDDINGSDFSPSFVDKWAHNPNDTYWYPNGSAQLETFFSGIRPGSTNSMGYVFGGTGGLVLRGAGTYMYSNEVGIYTADIGSDGNKSSPANYNLPSSARNLGFRCVVDLE